MDLVIQVAVSRIVSVHTEIPTGIHLFKLLWHRCDIHLPITGRVYTATERLVLPRVSETWLLKVEDVRKLLVFGHL